MTKVRFQRFCLPQLGIPGWMTGNHSRVLTSFLPTF